MLYKSNGGSSQHPLNVGSCPVPLWHKHGGHSQPLWNGMHTASTSTEAGSTSRQLRKDTSTTKSSTEEGSEPSIVTIAASGQRQELTGPINVRGCPMPRWLKRGQAHHGYSCMACVPHQPNQKQHTTTQPQKQHHERSPNKQARQ